MTRFMLSVSALALAHSASAQDVVQLPLLTLYSYQSAVEISRSGASVDVMDEDDLAETGATTPAQALDSLPGVSVTRAGPVGAVSSLRLRGLPGRYAPVYLNGVDITDPSAPQTELNWGNVLPGTISRVELVRGSQTTRFGSNAVAGVVAMDGVKAPSEPGISANLTAEAGGDDSTLFSFGVGVASERAGAAVQYTHFGTGGFSAIEGVDAQDDRDGHEGEALQIDLYVDLTDTIRLGYSGTLSEGSNEYDNCFSAIPGLCRAESELAAHRVYAEFSTGAVDHVLDVTHYNITRDYYSGGAFSYGAEGSRRTASYRGSWHRSEQLTVNFGLDGKQEDFTGGDEGADTTGVFAEALWTPMAGLDLALSLRHDDHSSFGGFTTGRASLAWQLPGDLTLRAVAANGFRAPSPYELYGPWGAGNPDLDPEQSHSYEIGLQKDWANGAMLRGTLFKTEIQDLIDYSFATFSYVQTDGTSSSRGVELAGYLPLGTRAQLEGSYTYTDTEDPDGDRLQRIPRHDLSLTLSGDLTDQLTGALTVQHSADWPDTTGVAGAGTDVDDFTVLNARLGYEFANGMEAYLRAENLLDADYQVIPGYQTPGRSVYFGINAEF